MSLSRSTFEKELAGKCLPLSFSGRPFYAWTSVQLRRLARLFQKDATFKRGHTKVDLVQQLIKIKSGPLTGGERRAVSAIRYGEDSAWATSLLVERTVPLPKISEKPIKPEVSSRTFVAGLFRRKQRRCDICEEDQYADDFLSVPDDATCDHPTVICGPCVTQHISAQVNFSPIDEIRCPEEHCEAILSYQQMEKHSAPDIFARYEDCINRRTLEQFPDFFCCANDKCSGGGWADENTITFTICS